MIKPEGKYIDTVFNNISINKSISNYDALYIPLAVNKGMPLLTLDKRRKNIALELGVNVLPYTSNITCTIGNYLLITNPKNQGLVF